MPSPTEAANFQQLLLNLGAVAATVVTTMWNDTPDSEELKEQYPPTIDPFLAAAATLAAQWYSLLSDAPFATEIPPLPQPEVLSASVGWSFTQSDPLQSVIGSTERHLFGTARTTVVANAEREGVKFARYASANACSWCRVLATREAVYSSAENAVKGHDNCHCLAVPVREGDIWTPPDYVQQWNDDYIAAREAVGGDLNAIVNHMRSNA